MLAWRRMECIGPRQKVDPAQPFLDQFGALFAHIPHLALYNVNPENSDYCNHAADMKDSYLGPVKE